MCISVCLSDYENSTLGGLWGLQVLLTVCKGFIPDGLISEINKGSVTMSHSLQSQTNIWKCILASASLTSNWYLRYNNLELIIVKELEIAIIFSLCEERGTKMKDFSCLSDILAFSPNDRFLTDQLYRLLLKPSNISLWNGFILISHLRDLVLNPRHPLCV